MDKLAIVAQPSLKQNPPLVKPGDTVKVYQIVREGAKERVQIFEGVVLSVKGGTGVSATFTVRKISFGYGVERTFPLHSPHVLKVERIKSSNTRRSKLYYLRELTGKAARLKNEKMDYCLWEEKGAEEKLEQIEEAVAEEAEARAEEKAEEAGDIVVDETVAQTDEEKAAIAAGIENEIKSDDETPTEVTRHEEQNK